jgi:predicted GIY-YIG superfamily endonuclease
MEAQYHLYVLYNEQNRIPIYVGLSKAMKSRINNHKIKKTFDAVLIIESFPDKKSGLIAERSLIKFLSFFKSESIVNGLYARLTHEYIPGYKFQNYIDKINDGKYN